MKACKSSVIRHDFFTGILSNPRFLLIPFLALLECFNADSKIGQWQKYLRIDHVSIYDLLVGIFQGADPLVSVSGKESHIAFPYLWFAIIVFSVFIGFDYMRKDMTTYGIQVIIRIRSRMLWWLTKCAWCLSQTIIFFLLFYGTVFLFGYIKGYFFSIPNNTEFINSFVDSSEVYTMKGLSEYTPSYCLSQLFAPFIFVLTINMINMTLSLFIRPMFSFLLSISSVLIGVLTDVPISFPRLAMLGYNEFFFNEGYCTLYGFSICAFLVIAALFVGCLFIKNYDILPYKE